MSATSRLKVSAVLVVSVAPGVSELETPLAPTGPW